jgi:hypothetical protein
MTYTMLPEEFKESLLPPTPIPKPTPPKLVHTQLIHRLSSGTFELHVKGWGEQNETFGDPLPFEWGAEAALYSLYNKYLNWNKWLGEQLMYADKREYLRLTGPEVLEFIAVANFAADYPEILQASAQEVE